MVKPGETRIALGNAADLIKVIAIVRRDVEHAVASERAMDRVEKFRGRDPPLLMPAFRPGIRKQKVERFHRVFRQQITHCVRSLQVQDSNVPDFRRFTTDLFDAPTHSLDPEEISLRTTFGHGHQKRSVPAPKIDLQWRASSKRFFKIQRLDVRFGDQFDHQDESRS